MRIGFSTRYASFSGPVDNGSSGMLNLAASFLARSASIWDRRTFLVPSGSFDSPATDVGSADATTAEFVALIR